MKTYHVITDKELETITKEQLASMYNDAVETVLLLEHKLKDLSEENDEVWQAYEEVANKFYG